MVKKHFSQNFLNNENIIQKIGDLMLKETNPKEELIVEIGPGHGELTKPVLERTSKMIMIEVDDELIPILEKKFSEEISQNKVEILHQDAFQAIQEKRLPKNFKLISNLPYHLASRILIELSINYPNNDFSIICQREVGEKIIKREKITLFGLWMNLIYECKKELIIKPGNFTPRPNVDSILIAGNSKKSIEYQSTQNDLEKFKILKIMTAMPRKTIWNNLNKENWNKELSIFFEEYKIDIKTRLNWNNYEQILTNFYDFIKNDK